MNKKQWLGLGLVAVAAVGLAACGNRSSRKADSSSDVKTKAAIVTDTGGVDDKSFNQSAWEGLQAWGKEHNLAKDKGFTYFQSTSEADYANNLQQAAGSYNLIFGVGFALHNAVKDAAEEHTDLNYVLIDDVIKDKKNVASVTFADNESGYLAGVAAAKTTKTKQVGFVGGMESEVISRFEAGFKAGVASVDPSIKVQVDYAGSFGDAAKGKTIAAAQYAAGADIVYQVAGGTGAGVFAEAKSLNESRPENEKVWVIGVDRDQEAEGKYTSKDGKESNFVLVSTLKQVGTTVKDISNKAEKGEFPGGQVIVYSLKDKGVDLAVTNLSEEGKKAVEAAKDKKNVASVTFADNESAYLAGVAAAKTTKTKQVGFVGGMESEVISRFEAGFKAGVASVGPSIKVQVDYAGSFGDAAKGKTIAAAQYAAGADVVYQAAGGTGAGVFAEAKSLNESRPENEKVWVIGVDRDQVAEGKYTSKDGKESNFVLVSTLKQVGTTVKDISNKAEKGEFPGGQVIVYSLKDKGVDLAVTNLSEEGKKAVEDAKAKILDGSVKVPEK